jgi:cytochrome c biogenesis protein CcmG/thiol:disulfide interchange protein DsbE
MVDVDTAPPVDAVRHRRRAVAPFVALALAVVLGALVVVLAKGKPAVDRFAKSPLVGKAAPAVAGKTYDGSQFTLADHKGSWVVVNFFAPWCVPCRQEQPALASFSQRHRVAGDGVELVGVVWNTPPDQLTAFQSTDGGDWPLVLDPDGQIGVDYGVAAMPETYIVDPAGFIRAKFSSAVTSDGLDQVITDLRNGVDPNR